jgi:hypothetical protein
MPATITNFVTSFKNELARPSRFDVQIPIPAILAPFYLNTVKEMNMRCEVAELPGRNFNTTERKFGSAPVQKVPYQSTYNDAAMTFIVSGDMKERMFFDQWMELINPSTTYNFRYKNDYVTNIAVTQYDMQNKVTYKSVLIDAYPVTVNQLDLDWTADNYHRLSVVFAYTNWQEGTVSQITTQLGVQGLAGFVRI